MRLGTVSLRGDVDSQSPLGSWFVEAVSGGHHGVARLRDARAALRDDDRRLHLRRDRRL